MTVSPNTTPEASSQASDDCLHAPSDAQRVASFASALDELRREVESQIGAEDARYIGRIGVVSDRLELLGRGLLHFSFEPVSFGLGTTALWAHKLLELMEIGHPALHGAYDDFPSAARYHSNTFKWKAPVDEASWRTGHNVRHHQYTNIEGKDPDLNFGVLRLSPRVPYRLAHALQPLTNIASWFAFTTAINMHVTGVLDMLFADAEKSDVLVDRSPETLRSARRAFGSKFARYYARELVFFPMLAGPFFAKVFLGNLLSDVGRDVYAGAIIYCGHVGALDYPPDTEPQSRAHWYVMQAEGARDVELPKILSILAGGLDLQIEHHLFPRLPPNRLRQIAPRVRAICEAHGVRYRSEGWPKTLRSVLGELRRISVRHPVPA